MKKKRLYFGLGLVLALAFLAYMGGLFSIGFDDFLLEDDFTIPSPALTKDSSVCQKTEPVDQGQPTLAYGSLTCNDGKWKTISKNDISLNINCEGGKSVVGMEKLENGKSVFNIKSQGKVAQATYLKNLKNNDIKIDFTNQISKLTDGTFLILFNDQTVFTKTYSSLTIENDYVLEARLDILDEELYHIFVNAKEVGTAKITDPQLTVTFQTESTGGLCTARPLNVITLNSIKSRPYFNCKIEDDEVVVRDVFVEGSKVSIKDLAYQPKKFCIENYPAIKRSLTKQGSRADILGSLTKQITLGQTLTVGKGETLEFYYVVDYKEGMGERCALDSAYDTKLKKCVKIIEDKPDIVEFKTIKEIVLVGKNQIPFTDTLQIGDTQITSSGIQYSCAEKDQSAVVPNPSADCWKTTVTYKGKNTPFIYGEEKAISPFVTLKWIPSAQTKDGTIKTSSNNFIATISEDALKLTLPEEAKEKYYVSHNAKRSAPFCIENNLANFQNSGLQLLITKEIISGQQEQKQQPIDFKFGKVCYELPIDSAQYGKQTIVFIPFVKIGQETVFDNEKGIKTYEITDTIPQNVTVQVETKAISTSTEGFKYWKELIYGILIASVIGLVIYGRK